MYIIVIDEAKKDIFDAINQNNLSETYSADFEGYTKLVMDGYSQKMTIKEKSNPTDTLANGLKIRKVSLTSVYNGIDAFMMLGFVEGKERYYQIFTWTLAKRKDKHEQKMVKMINSFKEL